MFGALTFVELSHIHTAVVHLQSGLQCRKELMQDGRVLQQGRGGGLDRLGPMHQRGRGGRGGRGQTGGGGTWGGVQALRR